MEIVPLRSVEVSTADIIKTVNQMHRENVESAKLAIGDYIFTEVFNEDLDEVLSKNPRKRASFREICEHSDLEVQGATLCRWVKAAALKRECEDHSIDVSGLSLSHLASLTRITDQDDRLVMVRHILDNRLSARDTSDEVDDYFKALRSAELLDISSDIDVNKIIKRLGNGKGLSQDTELVNVLSDRDVLETKLDSNSRLRLHKKACQVEDAIGKRIEAYDAEVDKIQYERTLLENNLTILGQLTSKLYEIEIAADKVA